MKRCPRCNSPAPHLHFAEQFEGKVQYCRDPYHRIVTPENTKQRIAAVKRLLDLSALEELHHACSHVRALWSNDLPRELAQANLEARVILFNAANRILAANSMGITREEIEGAVILERNC